MNYPEEVKRTLIDFLLRIKVEKYSDDWNAIQTAIAMINSPSSFRKGLHVFISSTYSASEEGAYVYQSMSIKIYQHKIQLRQQDENWVSGSDFNYNRIYRYICPSNKYDLEDFKKVMSLSDYFLFNGNEIVDTSAPYSHSGYSYAFKIETNIKKE